VWLKERREGGTKVKGVIYSESFNLGWSWSGLCFDSCTLLDVDLICGYLLSDIQSGGLSLLGICTFLPFA